MSSLRTSYLDEIADGVGERLLNVNDGFINSAPFKAAGWRPNSSHHKRTHSPPIPTAIASEYFQAPKQAGLTLEDGEEDGGMLTAGGMATRRRRRREQMEEEDSSDLSDESDDDTDQRAAQQIKFAKMPVRHRAGSSPLQNTNLRQVGAVSPRAPRRGSQRGLGETQSPAVRYHPKTRPIFRQSRGIEKLLALRQGLPSIQRADTSLLPEEEEDSDEASDLSDNYAESIDSASILDGVENAINASPTRQVVGTPPKNFVRQSTIRKSKPPAHPIVLGAPMSMIRPLSVAQPKSLLSAALKAKDKKSSIPFQKFAHFSGQGTQGSIAVRIYAPFSKTPSKPFQVLIRPRVHDGQGAERVKLEPPLPKGKLNINWWTLRMVEEGGEVDDDFPPFERTKPLTSFTTVNNAAARGGGRMRSNSTAYDDFALAAASEEEYLENNSYGAGCGCDSSGHSRAGYQPVSIGTSTAKSYRHNDISLQRSSSRHTPGTCCSSQYIPRAAKAASDSYHVIRCRTGSNGDTRCDD
ncbi:hypothetical protein LB503_006520 [Fusarium chuoi]|nr:hypothetical protein LB503_006520 [Fusarium chuoi]